MTNSNNILQELPSFDLLHPQPLLVVISGPSGIGKDTVLKSLKDRELPLHFVITATTRPPRAGERNGIDYFFISKQEFNGMIANDEFFEHALVYDQYKGVPKSHVREALASGKDVLMRLDVQGAAKVRSLCPDAILIFLIPTDKREWYERLKARQSETPEGLRVRIQTAEQELKHIPDFDYLVVNAHDRLEETVDLIIAIIKAEHHRVHHRKITL